MRKKLFFALFAALFAWFGKDGQAQNPPVSATQLRGRTISTTAPTNGQVYVWNASTGFWTAGSPAGGTVTSVSGTSPISVATGTTTPVVSLNDTAVTPAAYTNPNITVDQKGRITAAANGSSGASPAGAATQIQLYLDAAHFGASANFTYSDASGLSINPTGSGSCMFCGNSAGDGTGINIGVTPDANNQGPFGFEIDMNSGGFTSTTGPKAIYINVSGFAGSFGAEAISLYAGDMAGAATNAYYEWLDSRGVRRVREDNTFDSVGQAIEALYNPQFAKYIPGAVDFERVILGQWNGNVAEIGTEKGGTGTLRPVKLIGATLAVPVTTGAAATKHVVCVDNATKILYESSSSTDCSN